MSIIKNKDQRVGVFMDVQNMYHSAKIFTRPELIFGKF